MELSLNAAQAQTEKSQQLSAGELLAFGLQPLIPLKTIFILELIGSYCESLRAEWWGTTIFHMP